MNENKVRLKTTEDKKQKIRERHIEIDLNKLDVIPAVPVKNIFRYIFSSICRNSPSIF